MIHRQLCASCGMQGFHTPASCTVNDLPLCQSCLERAETFAGYPTWPESARQERAALLAPRKEAIQTRDLDLIPW